MYAEKFNDDGQFDEPVAATTATDDPKIQHRCEQVLLRSLGLTLTFCRRTLRCADSATIVLLQWPNQGARDPYSGREQMTLVYDSRVLRQHGLRRLEISWHRYAYD